MKLLWIALARAGYGWQVEVTPVDSARCGGFVTCHPSEIPRSAVTLEAAAWSGRTCDSVAAGFAELLQRGFAVFEDEDAMFRAEPEPATWPRRWPRRARAEPPAEFSAAVAQGLRALARHDDAAVHALAPARHAPRVCARALHGCLRARVRAARVRGRARAVLLYSTSAGGLDRHASG